MFASRTTGVTDIPRIDYDKAVSLAGRVISVYTRVLSGLYAPRCIGYSPVTLPPAMKHERTGLPWRYPAGRTFPSHEGFPFSSLLRFRFLVRVIAGTFRCLSSIGLQETPLFPSYSSVVAQGANNGPSRFVRLVSSEVKYTTAALPSLRAARIKTPRVTRVG